jgi:hypothetical protein
MNAELLGVSQVCRELRISRQTYYNWLEKGVAPRRSPGVRGKVSRAEIRSWAAALERDRQSEGKPHLRHPLPFSWLPEALEAAQAVGAAAHG